MELAKIETKIPPFPDLAGLPAMFQGGLPVQLPQLNYTQGTVAPLLSGFLHNWKLKQIERASEREADIAQNNLRKLNAQFGAIKELLLFGEKYNQELTTIKHQTKMMEIEEKKAEQELIGLQLQNMQAQIELQISQTDLKMRLKEAKEMGLDDE